MPDTRRTLPAIGTLLARDGVKALSASSPRQLVTEAARRVVAAVRDGHAALPRDDAEWDARVAAALAALERPSLRPVFNATGVVLHTNLGRAPLAPAALDAIARTASGACNLEYDIEAGARGSRYGHCVALLRELTGAEDAIVVNNCAAALVLALNTFSRDREAVISRGELVEIGGSFRVPEIMARSGAVLREVGTTNRTHADDYRAALGDQSGALVKVHRSNFEITGFVAEASLRDLAPIAAEQAIPLLYDFGSGLLVDLGAFGLRGEPLARDAVRDGATLTLMSGDKLLGGPQAGIIVGTAAAVAACRRNPLCRALRVDKLTLAALEATLALYRDPARALREVPALAMLTAPPSAVRERAESLGAALATAGIAHDVVASEATVGGGAFPSARIPSTAVALAGSASRLDERLRHGEAAIVGRIEHERLLLDLRSIPAMRDDDFRGALLRTLAPSLA
ncbi:MAG: L-seryl-tRNA(Sec) selenium transferase [Gemmatimonadetes bacterium]|nr:L-seryl-tRNA(Sec) selenium transferase [Gemmatimonadota bacterium]